jgi:NhaP-type Na+/H+ and K+/H+ antiporter
VGFGLNARRAMEIILALLALEAGLLKVQVFAALVVMALLTSLISGPTMKWMLRGVDEEKLPVAQVARAVIDKAARERLLKARSVNEALMLLSEHRPQSDSMRPRRASLADI